MMATVNKTTTNMKWRYWMNLFSIVFCSFVLPQNSTGKLIHNQCEYLSFKTIAAYVHAHKKLRLCFNVLVRYFVLCDIHLWWQLYHYTKLYLRLSEHWWIFTLTLSLSVNIHQCPHCLRWTIIKCSPIFKTVHIVKKIWRVINIIASIWGKKICLDICPWTLPVNRSTVFLEPCSQKTVPFLEQIMSVDKHPCISLGQMEAIVYIMLMFVKNDKQQLFDTR